MADQVRCALAMVFVCAPFYRFFIAAAREWFQSEVFSYGILIPVLAGYFLWQKWPRISQLPVLPWNAGIGLVALGYGILLMGEMSGLLLVSGAALILVLLGTTGSLWGWKQLRQVAIPVAFLIFMVPWPPYVLGSLSWRLQAYASVLSASILEGVGVPVFQDGNLLYLPNYVMAVKEACSGTRSLFALLALAASLGILTERSWAIRILLVLSAPLMALLANVVRIVGTGLVAISFGREAAEGTLHTMWGMVVFLLGAAGLVAIQRISRWLIGQSATSS